MPLTTNLVIAADGGVSLRFSICKSTRSDGDIDGSIRSGEQTVLRRTVRRLCRVSVQQSSAFVPYVDLPYFQSYLLPAIHSSTAVPLVPPSI